MSRLSLLLLFLLQPLGAGAAEPLSVFVSVAPLKTFVERVGGERVRVQVMVRPGHSPATYDATPRQVAELAGASLYVRVGVPFETAWMPRIRSANPDMQVLDLRDGMDLRRTDGHHHQGPGGHEKQDGGETMDAHVWTSPLLVKRMAGSIRDALTGLDPDGARIYSANHDAFAAETDALDGELRSRLAGLSNRRFMVFHPAWGYFADTYGLTQISIEREGKEPGARALAALVDQARREGVRVIFIQPQFNRKAAEQVARAVGGRVHAIDPLAEDYAENLRRVARFIAEADAGTDGPETAD